jgi:uncharacterized membrane protein
MNLNIVKLSYLNKYKLLFILISSIISIFIIYKYYKQNNIQFKKETYKSYKGILNINNIKLKENPKSVSFNLEPEIIYFNENKYIFNK